LKISNSNEWNLRAAINRVNIFVAGFIDFIVDPSMQVMGDMLERVVQSSAQQAASQQNTTSDRHVVGFGSSKTGDDLSPSAANGGANNSSNSPIAILPGTTAMQWL